MALLPFKLFSPILAGATLRDRLFASLGAIVGIALTGLVCTLVFGRDPHLPFIVAPVGASAVLLFAVPASPLAQPWSIIGGNTLSALCGIAVTQFVHEPMLAIGLAVGLAIGTAATATVKDIVNGFISPIVQFIVGTNDQLTQATWTFKAFGRTADFAWGAALSSTITLIATALVIYWLVNIFRLNRLDKKKDS